MARKNNYKPKTFESDQRSGDTSANIYLSMLTSAAWQDLGSTTKVLYIYMKSQYYGQKPIKDFDQDGNAQALTGEYFYFNRSLARNVFGIKNPTQLNKDIKSLENHGFILTYRNGKNHWTKNIYKFCDCWINWKPETPEH